MTVRKPSDQNIRAIARLEEEALRERSMADHAALAITRAAASGVNVVLHLVGFAIWIGVNIGLVSGVAPFDEPPFEILIVVLSIEVTLLSFVVLRNQNRLAYEVDRRAHLNLQVDLLAERELTMVLRMQRELSHHLGLAGPVTRELEKLLEQFDVQEIATKLDAELPGE